MKLTRNLGMLLLAIWLILTGLIDLGVVGDLDVVLGIVAIAAAILILLGR